MKRLLGKLLQIIELPDWLGSTQKNGVEQGPVTLSKKILESGFAISPEVQKINIADPNPLHTEGEFVKVKYLPEILQNCLQTQKIVSDIFKNGKVPLGLMSNDSAMMGLFSAVAAHFGPDIGLIWFDAHGDCNTPETSPSGRLYGMPLAHLLGFGDERLTGLNPGKSSVRSENVFLLGPRCLDEGEIALIKKENINYFHTNDLNNISTTELIKQISGQFRAQNCKFIFIHVDLDVLEPMQSPGVSMHEENGLAVDKFLQILDGLVKTGFQFAGFNIAEYNPSKDENKKTENIILKAVELFAG